MWFVLWAQGQIWCHLMRDFLGQGSSCGHKWTFQPSQATSTMCCERSWLRNCPTGSSTSTQGGILRGCPKALGPAPLRQWPLATLKRPSVAYLLGAATDVTIPALCLPYPNAFPQTLDGISLPPSQTCLSLPEVPWGRSFLILLLPTPATGARHLHPRHPLKAFTMLEGADTGQVRSSLPACLLTQYSTSCGALGLPPTLLASGRQCCPCPLLYFSQPPICIHTDTASPINSCPWEIKEKKTIHAYILIYIILHIYMSKFYISKQEVFPAKMCMACNKNKL